MRSPSTSSTTFSLVVIVSLSRGNPSVERERYVAFSICSTRNHQLFVDITEKDTTSAMAMTLNATTPDRPLQ
jgi:hypothetical protein